MKKMTGNLLCFIYTCFIHIIFVKMCFVSLSLHNTGDKLNSKLIIHKHLKKLNFEII